MHDIPFGVRLDFVAISHLWCSCTNYDWLKIKRTVKSNLFPYSMYTSRVQCFCSGPHSPMVASIWNFLVQVQNLKRILVRVENEEALHIAGVGKLEKHLQILASPCNIIKYKYILFPSVFGYDKLWTTVLRTKLLPVDEERLFELIVIRSDVTSIGFGVRASQC